MLGNLGSARRQLTYQKTFVINCLGNAVGESIFTNGSISQRKIFTLQFPYI